MPAVSLKCGTEMVLDDHFYKIMAQSDDGAFTLICKSLGKSIVKTESQIMDLIERSKVRLLSVGKDYSGRIDKDLQRSVHDKVAKKMNGLGAKDKSEALRRRAYVQKFIKQVPMVRTPKRVEPLIEETAREIGDHKPPSFSTFNRWYKMYTYSGGDMRALVPNFQRRGCRKVLSDEVQNLIDNSIREVYLNKFRAPARDVIAHVQCEISERNRARTTKYKLKMPSKRTIYRKLEGMNIMEKVEARQGRRASRRLFKGVGKGVKTTRPLERVEIDHTVMDVFLVDRETGSIYGRPTLTVAIDCHTRMIVGYYIGFEPPSYVSVLHCLKQAILPKDNLLKRYPEVEGHWPCHGVFETLVVDNGREFHSHDLEMACTQLGIELFYTPRAMPHYKGMVERFMNTVNTEFLQGLPGGTVGLKKIEHDYDPEKDAVVDIHDFEKLFLMWLVDGYSKQFHRGLKDIPIEAWVRSIEAHPHIRVPSSSEDLRFIMSKREERTIRKDGVEFLGLLYNCDDLSDYRMEIYEGKNPICEVLINPEDLSNVEVVTKEGEVITVPAVDMEYTDCLCLYEHKVVRREWMKRKQDNDEDISLAETRVRIRQMILEVMSTKRSVKVSKRIARYQDVGTNNSESVGGAENHAPQSPPEQKYALPIPAPEDDWEEDGGADEFTVVRSTDYA